MKPRKTLNGSCFLSLCSHMCIHPCIGLAKKSFGVFPKDGMENLNALFGQPSISIYLHSLDALLEKAMAPHSSTLAWKIPWIGGAWWAAVHGVAKSWTRLGNFTLPFHFHALEKEMATHSSVLAWGIPGTGEPGGLPSMGSHRVGHD